MRRIIHLLTQMVSRATLFVKKLLFRAVSFRGNTDSLYLVRTFTEHRPYPMRRILTWIYLWRRLLSHHLSHIARQSRPPHPHQDCPTAIFIVSHRLTPHSGSDGINTSTQPITHRRQRIPDGCIVFNTPIIKTTGIIHRRVPW